MPYAVMAYFDPNTEAALRAIWKDLDDSGAAPYLNRSANRPHFKLEIFEEFDLSAARAELEALAARVGATPVHFKSIGIFPNEKPTVFAAPAPSVALLALQSQVSAALAPLGQRPPFNFFNADHWLPHCLLGFDLEPAALPAALACAMRLRLPFDGSITEIGLVEFHPVRHLFALRLSGARPL